MCVWVGVHVRVCIDRLYVIFYSKNLSWLKKKITSLKKKDTTSIKNVHHQILPRCKHPMSGSLLSLAPRTEICGQDEEPVPFPGGEQSGNLPAVSTRRSKCCPRRQLPEWGWGGGLLSRHSREHSFSTEWLAINSRLFSLLWVDPTT